MNLKVPPPGVGQGPQVNQQKDSQSVNEGAAKVAQAFSKLTPELQDELAANLPVGTATEFAQAIVGGKFTAEAKKRFILNRTKVKDIASMIIRGAPRDEPANDHVAGRVMTAFGSAADRIGDLREAMQNVQENPTVARKVDMAKTIAAMAKKGGVSPEHLDLLAGQLQTLAEKGRMAGKLSTDGVKSLQELVGLVSQALGVLATAEVAKQPDVNFIR